MRSTSSCRPLMPPPPPPRGARPDMMSVPASSSSGKGGTGPDFTSPPKTAAQSIHVVLATSRILHAFSDGATGSVPDRASPSAAVEEERAISVTSAQPNAAASLPLEAANNCRLRLAAVRKRAARPPLASTSDLHAFMTAAMAGPDDSKNPPALMAARVSSSVDDAIDWFIPSGTVCSASRQSSAMASVRSDLDSGEASSSRSEMMFSSKSVDSSSLSLSSSMP
mmetsp:Transcript_538/g.1642  ORF Transcript_538/g.1642 Transcript_538/m.1642 type:complete len:224 (-) Transcript_538:1554-2225(-)